MFEYERLESLEVYRRDASMVVRPEEIFKEGLEVTERNASTDRKSTRLNSSHRP